MDWLLVVAAAAAVLSVVLSAAHLVLVARRPTSHDGLTASLTSRVEALTTLAERTERAVREEHQAMRLEAEARGRGLREEVAGSIDRLASSSVATHADLADRLRGEIGERLERLRAENVAQLESIRATVEDKLQGTLERRLGESFALVSDRLELVHRGLGEMQTLAIGVGDLKRVMSNVKSRGGWAEVQLGAMLEQTLIAAQYAANVPVEPGGTDRVEFAVRMPGQGGAEVLLPIDAKFPRADYERLQEAWDAGDADAARAASDALAKVVEGEAQRIHGKYLRPPHTTDFAVMYLPTEGLFAEVMRRPGLAQGLQANFRVTVAGPTTLAALLNSLQMGFRSLAIQQRSSEVWRVLGEAKAEFQRYAEEWERLSRQLQSAQNTIDSVGRRTRSLERKLRGVEVDELPALDGPGDGEHPG
jgi:DNA recombination protein RmuC